MKYMKGDVFPYTESHLKADNPNTSFPSNPLSNEDIRSSFGIEEVGETAIPEKKGYKAVQGEVGIADGKKVETWDLIAKTIDEIEGPDIIAVNPDPPEAHKHEPGTPAFVDGEGWKQTWNYVQLSGVEARLKVYGPATDQIEFITENGLDAWQAKVAEIKSKYPK